MTTDTRQVLVRLDVKWTLLRHHVAFLRRFLRLLRDNVFSCSYMEKSPSKYRRLRRSLSADSSLSKSIGASAAAVAAVPLTCADVDSDLVPVKISLLGDCRIGKTSFMMKYVGGAEEEQRGLQMGGLNLMDKMFSVRGARIMHSIWDVGGDHRFLYHLPIACKDSAAILFMFDLTNRCSLNNVLGWYIKARKWNKSAIPILIGTKFDEFIHLPRDMQWTIVNEARAFARAMNATLFFSSSTHNINVNKIFKFVTAKIFNLPWTVERNLKLGEPIIDF